MTSTGVNVLRWSALGLGIFYGLSHQMSISSSERAHQIQKEYERKQHLIQDAKAAYVKKTMPADKQTAGGGIITDPEDPKFDLEAYLTTTAAETK